MAALGRYSRQDKYTILVSSIYPEQSPIKGTYGFVVLRFRIDNTAHCLCIMKWRSDKSLNVYTLISTGCAGTSIPSNFCRGFASVGVISRNRFLPDPFAATRYHGYSRDTSVSPIADRIFGRRFEAFYSTLPRRILSAVQLVATKWISLGRCSADYPRFGGTGSEPRGNAARGGENERSSRRYGFVRASRRDKID